MAKKGVIGALVVIGVIAVIGGAMMSIEFDEPISEGEFDTLGDSFGNEAFGEVRNCIRSFMGNEPECSDYSERILETTCNGRSLGQIPYSQARFDCASQ